MKLATFVARLICVLVLVIAECGPTKAFCDPADVNGVTLTSNCALPNDPNKLTLCPEQVPPGTIASVACKHGYERSRQTPHKVTCDSTGRWLPEPFPCQQVCGEVYSETHSPLVGSIKTATEPLWHAGVYKKNGALFKQVCGATIVNARVVVSAMHCFWDVDTSAPHNKSEYSIAVGKTKRDYRASEDEGFQQNLQIESLHYVDGYSHASKNHADDIAVVVLQESIEFKPHISPVCVPYDLGFDERTMQSGLSMKVAGWRLKTSERDPNAQLKFVELLSISRRDCATTLADRRISSVISSDKFCAGFRDGEQSVCSGDGGGGLVLSDIGPGNITIHYLRGIVSRLLTDDDTCDSGSYSQVTNVATHLELIDHYDRMYRPENKLLERSNLPINEPASQLDLETASSQGIALSSVEDSTQDSSQDSTSGPTQDSTQNPVQGSTTQCVVIIPPNARAEDALNASRAFASNEVVPPLTAVRFKCDTNYVLIGKEINYCIENQWEGNSPTCESLESGRCRIDKVPEGGWIEDSKSLRRISDGESVEDLTVVRYKCLVGLPMMGEESNLCFRGKWQKEAPTCDAVCDTATIRGISIKSSCEIDGVLTPCSGHVKNGTKAVFTCQEGYERDEPKEQISYCSSSVGWLPKPQPCTPICGIMNLDQDFGIGRFPMPNYSAVPWIAGVYWKGWDNRLSCIGTILSTRVVGLGMHCITRSADQAPFNATDIWVVVGELRYGTLKEDAQSGPANQTFRVEAIWQTGYKDLPNSRIRDFAFLILEKDIIFGYNVAPICIEFGARDFVPKGELGYYFGYVERIAGDLPPLDALVVPILDGKECVDHVEEWFKPHFSEEAYCSGPMKDRDTGICGGETGTSLTIPKRVGDRTVFFLHGFLSVYSKHDGCQTRVYSAVTSIHYFQDFAKLVLSNEIL